MTTIPTIRQLYASIKTDIEAAFGDSIPLFGKNFLRASAMVQAGRLNLFYRTLGDLQKNIFIDTANPESGGGTLERFGRVKLDRDPFPATAGQYVLQVTGTVGATINASQTFKSNDDSLNPGMLFILDNSYALVSATDFITVRALTAGLDSRLAVGNGVTATSPIANVNSATVVTSEAVIPLAAEEIETYREAGVEAYRLEPQGGAASDYRLWATGAQGVQQTYAFAKSGSAGEINIFVEATIVDSTDGKGTPSGAILVEVEAVVEFDPDTTKPLTERGRRPLGVFQVHYLAVTPLNVEIQIAGFSGITAAQKTLIFAAMQEALSTVRPYVAGADVLADKNDTFSINNIISEILSTIPGSQFTSVTMTVAGSSVSSYQFLNGYIPFLNAITYV